MLQTCRNIRMLSLIFLVSTGIDAAQPPAEPVDPPPPGLENQPWSLVSYSTETGMLDVISQSKAIRWSFKDGQVAASTGCNQLSGSYSLVGTTLTIDPRMASTMMACPEPLMQQEQAIIETLGSIVTYRQRADELELLDAEGKVRLQLHHTLNLPLTGHLWQLDSYNNGKAALVSPVRGTEVNLEFTDRGTLSGSDGCNRYMTGYRLDNAQLTIGPIATTRMACRAADGRAEQAAAYAAALSRVSGYRIERNQLTLLNDEGTVAARFHSRETAASEDPSE